MPDTAVTETPKRLQCRHIFNDGRRCGAVCLRNQEFCYYHHTTRRPPAASPDRQAAFDLPLPEDRSAIQTSIGLVLQRIASNDLDPRRAGLLPRSLRPTAPAASSSATSESVTSQDERPNSRKEKPCCASQGLQKQPKPPPAIPS